MAAVYGVATEAGDCGGDSKAVPEMRVCICQLRRVAKELPDTDIFVGLLAAGEQLKAASKLKGFTDGGGRGAIDVRRAARLRNLGDETRAEYFGAHASTRWACCWDGTEFPTRAHQDHAHWSQQELWDKPQHLTGNQWQSAADRG